MFTTKLFDKRDHFGFHITRMPYKSSNIPNRMFYSTIRTECLRLCRATSGLDNVLNSIKALIKRMLNQGAEHKKIRNCIRRAFNKHNVNLKYNTPVKDIITHIFA